MFKISAAENTPYGEYYAPVYYSTYTDKEGKVHEDVGEVRIIVKEIKSTKIFRKAMGIIILVLSCIVGLAMIFYVLVRIARGSEELEDEAEDAEVEEDE